MGRGTNSCRCQDPPEQPFIPSVDNERTFALGEVQAHLGSAVEVGLDFSFVKTDIAPNVGVERFVNGFLHRKTEQHRDPPALFGDLFDEGELVRGQHLSRNAQPRWTVIFQVNPKNSLVGAGSHSDRERALMRDRASNSGGQDRSAAVIGEERARFCSQLLASESECNSSADKLHLAVATALPGKILLFPGKSAEDALGNRVRGVGNVHCCHDTMCGGVMEGDGKRDHDMEVYRFPSSCGRGRSASSRSRMATASGGPP